MTVPRGLPPSPEEALNTIIKRMLLGAAGGQTRAISPVGRPNDRAPQYMPPPASGGATCGLVALANIDLAVTSGDASPTFVQVASWGAGAPTVVSSSPKFNSTGFYIVETSVLFDDYLATAEECSFEVYATGNPWGNFIGPSGYSWPGYYCAIPHAHRTSANAPGAVLTLGVTAVSGDVVHVLITQAQLTAAHTGVRVLVAITGMGGSANPGTGVG